MNTERRQKARNAFIEAYGESCWWCPDGLPQSVDHVIPRSRGGCDHQHNIVAACFDCNNEKGDGFWPEIPSNMWVDLYNCPKVSNDIYRAALRDYWEPPLFELEET